MAFSFQLFGHNCIFPVISALLTIIIAFGIKPRACVCVCVCMYVYIYIYTRWHNNNMLRSPACRRFARCASSQAQIRTALWSPSCTIETVTMHRSLDQPAKPYTLDLRARRFCTHKTDSNLQNEKEEQIKYQDHRTTWVDAMPSSMIPYLKVGLFFLSKTITTLLTLQISFHVSVGAN